MKSSLAIGWGRQFLYWSGPHHVSLITLSLILRCFCVEDDAVTVLTARISLFSIESLMPSGGCSVLTLAVHDAESWFRLS
ncbi:hypothetical protein C8R44DRAFT_815415 [Mycena epipterygia]|nr:hypothetical protein C8R44DRAFT_815415 [Mycena epipterygia]